jgi:hypothetical protein
MPTRRSHRRSRRARKIEIYVLAACVGALAALVSYPVLKGWTRVPAIAREAARQAVEEARSAEAPRWAPDLFVESENLLRANLTEERRQNARLLFFRDFRAIEAGYRTAAARAAASATASLERKSMARDRAAKTLERAGRTLEEVKRRTERIPLGKEQRVTFQAARIHLGEGQSLFRSSEYEDAEARANLAIEEARRACGDAVPSLARYTDENHVQTWRRWVRETVDGSREKGRPAIIVYKEKNQLVLYDKGKPVRTFAADMGFNSIHDKRSAGDQATPEGRYRITAKKDRGQSEYYKALAIDYPNERDRRDFEKGRREGRIPKDAKLGQFIEIHGDGGRRTNWTQGCIALSNPDMDELFSRVAVGTPVTIVGGEGEGGMFSDFIRDFGASGRTDGP